MENTPIEKARKNYEDKRKTKRVSFNPETEAERLKFADSIEFSTWVKQKIDEELKNSK